MTQMNAVGWFDIYVSEMHRAEGFYKTVLGAEMEDMTDPTGETEMKSFVADMGVYGAAGALVKAPYAKPGPGGTQIYFSVEDCATEQARIEAAGGQIIRPKFSIGEYGYVTLAQDTEGNLIGFNSLK
ncbi:VOC family protein [Donghicola eburneus]|uniref:Glyoxylase family protein n=1 Tax=Donghicola eburneus TaxID=393278 RepID=A0A1M4MWM5_9RHOB|nr:VOC family protein [Donghicola eburneus]SCM66943.1 glyoxylase family protein [Donghicola eburneus]